MTEAEAGPRKAADLKSEIRATGLRVLQPATQVVAIIPLTGPVTIVVTNPVVNVGVGISGLSANYRNAANDGPIGVLTELQCVSQNIVDGAVSGVPTFHVRLMEGFTSPLRILGTPQFTPGPADGEAGYPAPGSGAGGGATQGTRILLRFFNVPSGVRIAVPDQIQQDGLTLSRIVGADGGGAGGAASGGVGLAELSVSGGFAAAVYEVVESDGSLLESGDIPIVISWTADTANDLPAVGTMQVNARLAPLSTVATSDLDAPEPRFVDVGDDPQSVLEIRGCLPAPDPTITNLVPESVIAGAPGFDLMVNGTGFVPDFSSGGSPVTGSTVQWNGTPLPTTFTDTTQLTAAVAGNLVAQPGVVAITVVNPGDKTSDPVGVTIDEAVLRITTESPLPLGFVGVEYVATLEAAGGTPPYTWEQGFAAAGLETLDIDSGSGQITGTPLVAGTFSVTYRVTDSKGTMATEDFEIRIIDPLTITTDSFPVGEVGVPYTVTLMASGGMPPYTWSILKGSSFPAGLALEMDVITGTPSQAGTYSFTLEVTDSEGLMDSRTFEILIIEGLTITTASPLPTGKVGNPYNVELSAAGGVPSYSWSLVSAIPPELDLKLGGRRVGVFSFLVGTPRAAGTYSMVIMVTDRERKTDSKRFDVEILPGFNISTPRRLRGAGAGTSYRTTLRALGGTPPYVWSTRSGSLPAGLGLDTQDGEDGEISGVPTEKGSFRFTARVVDTTESTVDRTFSIDVVEGLPLLIATQSPLPKGEVGQVHNILLTAAGGSQPYAWSVAGGALPPGLKLDPQTGLIAGTPTVPGTFEWSIVVTDSEDSNATKTLSIMVDRDPSEAPKLGVEPGRLTVDLVQSSALETQLRRLAVLNHGGGSLTFSAEASTGPKASGWLAGYPAGGDVSAAQPTFLTVTIDAAGLAPGSYSGEITVSGATSSETVVVPVTLAISARQQILRVSQLGLTFTAVSGENPPLAQTLRVFNDGPGVLNWDTFTSTDALNPIRLLVSPSSGSTEAFSSSPLEVGLNLSVSGPGAYYGLVEVSAPDAAGSPQVVLVVVNVLPEGTGLAPFTQPVSLQFVGEEGGPRPTQTIKIFSPGGSGVTWVYGSSKLSLDGLDWFTHFPTEGSISAAQPALILVQPDLPGLAPGTYRSFLTLEFRELSSSELRFPLLVPITLVVTPEPGGDEQELRIFQSGCFASELQPTLNLVGGSSPIWANWPTGLEVTVVDNCGIEMDQGSVVVDFNNLTLPSLPLARSGAGLWSGTWNVPHTTEPLAVSVTAVARDFRGISGDSTTALQIQPHSSPPPQVAEGGLRHAASFVEEPVAPGTIISVFGQGLSDKPLQSSGEAAAGLPLPSDLADTAITIGGVPVPLLFSRDDQVNAVTPFELADRVNEKLPLVVSRRSAGSFSIPTQVLLTAARPGIFTRSATGVGAAAVQDAAFQLVDAGNPVSAGDVIIIYAAGLGEVSPPVPTAEGAPFDTLSRTTQEVQVTIGGLAAQVLFAGLTPGLAGLYQVNAIVPEGVPPGEADLVISVEGQASSSEVTMAVQ